ncbi:pyridoxal phosphate-dependent aminotransferase [Flexithrix dorotheae]|uniref:pyridoxal phosphate-dependent aminotransferase n=1 Tax=Flexithrix dorotheae TaxID=70993 RepID=UPI0003736B38|nr:histidinol-phosphate transaminase [Flexithrix dorotheae]
MKAKLNRRDWLRSSLLATGGLGLGMASVYGATPNAKPFWLNKPRVMVKPFAYDKYNLKAKLNANENKFGPSKLALEAITESASIGNLYAHYDVIKLREMLAEKEGVKPEQIILGPGSTDLLEKTAVITFRDGKGNIVSADPTYMSVVRSAKRVGATWKNIPCKTDWSHDLEGMMDAIDDETRLIYICNPNNPTGAITDGKALWDFCAKASEKAPVFVDEAYLDFMEEKDQKSMVGLIAEGKDIILARTFSKIHGMAGLRVGYLVAKEERVESINNILRSSYNLSITSLRAAMASIKDEEYLKMSRAKNLEAKGFVYEAFKEMGVEYIPSSTSFIFFKLPVEGEAYMKSMYGQGVGVRLFDIDDEPWGRVSMGTMEEMELFVPALKKTFEA